MDRNSIIVNQPSAEERAELLRQERINDSIANAERINDSLNLANQIEQKEAELAALKSQQGTSTSPATDVNKP